MENAKPLNRLRKPTGEKALFLELWNTRPRNSFITGKPIKIHEESPLWVSVFGHVLNKGAHRQQRLNPENIVFLLPEEHRLYDQGTEEQRQRYADKTGADWQKLYDLKEELRRKYYL